MTNLFLSFSSQQDWFEVIKTWRESLAKYQPDWEEILAATTVVEKPVEKSAKKPIVSSTTKCVDDEKKIDDDTNKEKAPKRKPIVFDLEVTEKDVEVNAIDIIKSKPVPAKPKEDKFVVRAFFERNKRENRALSLYSARRLIGSLWADIKVITLTE